MPSQITIDGMQVCLLCRKNAVNYPTQFCFGCADALRQATNPSLGYAVPAPASQLTPGPVGPTGPTGAQGVQGPMGMPGRLEPELTDAMTRTINSIDEALREAILDPELIRQAIAELRDALLQIHDK